MFCSFTDPTQLEIVTKKNIPQLLVKIFSDDAIKQGVITDVSSCQFDVTLWLNSLWGYLKVDYTDTVVELEHIPIIQLNINSKMILLAPKVCYSRVLLTKGSDSNLPSEIQPLLKDVGVLLTNDLPNYITMHPTAAQTYLRPPTYKHILQVMMNVSSSLPEDEIDKSITKCSSSCIQTFHKVISGAQDIQKNIGFLRKLKIFQSLDKTRVSINDTCQAVAVYDLPVNPPELFIDASHDIVRLSAEMLGATFLTSLEIIKHFFLPPFEKGDITTDCDTIMMYILDKLEAFESKDPLLNAMLSRIAFVRTEKRNRRKASELFFPDKHLISLFLEQDVFPAQIYQTPVITNALKRLGLKKAADVTQADICEACQICSNISVENRKRLKSIGITKFWDKNPWLFENLDSNILQVIKTTEWMPVLLNRPNEYPSSLPWYHSEAVTSPENMGLASHFHVVGSVAPVNDLNLSDRLKGELTLKTPAADAVMKHLGNVVHCYNVEDKIKYQNIICSVYRYMSTNFSTDEIKQSLFNNNLTDWIWNGTNFSNVQNIVVQALPMNLHTYMYVLPQEVMMAEEMLVKLGVHRNIEYSDLVKVLQKLWLDHQGIHELSHSITRKNKQLALEIIEFMTTNFDEEMIMTSDEELLVPIHDGGRDILTMRSRVDCCYIDDDWKQRDLSYDDIDDDVFLIHPQVSESACNKLGVPSLTSRILDTQEMPICGFGQSEQLTTRLKHLLEDYTDGLAIFKELIQNADDAGATEMKFLLDSRTNDDSMTHLLDKNMRECQGPALWAYNNSVFTDTDIGNIIKLGGATKEDQPVKIGKFGLGFNAVYNMTDVPSFLTRHYMVIFDPHMNHIGHAARNGQPGVQINLAKNKKALKKWCDHFQLFNGVFGCEINLDGDVDFKGTLFRFPLRTSNQAKRSLISNAHYREIDVMETMQMLAKTANNILMFTQHVKQLAFYRMGNNTDPSTSDMLFTVQKSLSADVSFPKCEMFHGSDSPLEIAVQFMDKVRSGRRRVDPEEQLTQSCIVDIVIDISDIGRDFIKIETEKSQWLITHSLGTNTSLTLALDDPKKGKNPIGSISVLLSAESVHAKYLPVSLKETERADGRIFCFMPLPVHSGTPVHINGAFAILSSRRSLCEKTDDDRAYPEEEWNRALMEDAVCKAYIGALSQFTMLSSRKSDFDYTSLWPKPETMSKHCHGLDKSFYRKLLTTNGAPVMQKSGILGTIENILLLDWCQEECQKEALEVMEIARKDALTVCLPSDILSRIIEADVQGNIKNRVYDIQRFLTEIFLPNITLCNQEVRDRLVIFALNLKDKAVDDAISKSPCIPASPDGKTLKMPKDLVNPLNGCDTLFFPEEGMFPVETYCEDTILLHLDRTGLRSLSWELLLERAKTLQNLFDEDMYERKKCEDIQKKLLTTLSMRLSKLGETGMSNTDIEEYRNAFSQIGFLKICPKPKQYPMPWGFYNEDELVCSDEAISWDNRYLASSLRPVVDTQNWSKSLKVFLHLDTLNISTDVCIKHLETVIASFSARSVKATHKDNVMEAMQHIYHYLQDDKEACESLKQSCCLFTGDTFVQPNQVCFKGTDKLNPLLYKIPREIEGMKTFLENIGVKEDFSSSDYIGALRKLEKKQKNESLSEEMTNVVNRLAKKLSILEQEHEVKDLFLANVDKQMRCASSLLYDSTDWLKTAKSSLVHPGLKNETALKLGVLSTRDKHVLNLADQFASNLTMSLVDKLIGCHPFDTSIFDHMVQTAEQHEATDIHFFLDKTQHPISKTFSDEWRSLQGPALCVYMNKPLTENDFKRLESLIENDDIPDIIHSGYRDLVWLCTAFQLTDVPSILTKSSEHGEIFYVLDPSLKFIDKVDHPGCRFENVGELRSIFPDVMSSFIGDFSGSEGTLFRFPLRHKQTASILFGAYQVNDEERAKYLESLSRRKICEMSKMDVLLQEYVSTTSESFVFSETLRDVKMTVITENCKHKEINSFSIIRKPNKIETHQTFFRNVKEYANLLEHQSFSHIPMSTHTYDVKIKSKNYKDECMVVQTVGPNDSIGDYELQDAFCKKYKTFPRGGVALLSRKISNFVPNHTLSTRLFSFTPLNIRPELPVHIFGDFSVKTDSKDGIILRDEGIHGEWNTYIATAIIARSYVELLLASQKNVTDMCKYHKDFPFITKKVDLSLWGGLAKATYKEIVSSDAALFPCISNNNVEWYSVSKSFFKKQMKIDYARSIIQVTNDSKRLCESMEILCDCGMPIVDVSDQILASLCCIEENIKYIDPQKATEFFNTTAPTWLDKLPVILSDTPVKDVKRLKQLVDYCKDDYEQFYNCLIGLPFLLTADNMLDKFQPYKDIYCSTHLDLLPKHANKFVHSDFVDQFKKAPVGQCGIIDLDISALSSMLQDYLSDDKVQTHHSEPSESPISLKKLWACISDLSPKGDKLKNRTFLTPLNDLCLVPAVDSEQYYIFRLDSAYLATTRKYKYNENSSVEKVIDKFKLPNIDLKGFDKRLTEIVGPLTCTPCNPLGVLKCLALKIRPKIDVGHFKLAQYDCDILLRFFGEMLPDLREKLGDDDKIMELLRQCPIYTTAMKKQINLERCCVYLVPADAVDSGMDSWQNSRENVFLRQCGDEHITEVYKFLNARFLTYAELYCDFIFQHFEMFTIEQRIDHLCHLNTKFVMVYGLSKDAKREAQSMVHHMSRHEIITSSDGTLQRANFFYDSRNQIFKTMIPQNELTPELPSSFANTHSGMYWSDFLVRLGMTSAVTCPLFTRFATQLSQQKPVSEKEAYQSEVLIRELWKLDKASKDTSLVTSICQNVKNIPFVYCCKMEKPYARLLPQWRTNELVKFGDCLPKGVALLGWSQCYILPDWAVPRSSSLKKEVKDNVMSLLRITYAPPADKLISHLSALCKKYIDAITEDKAIIIDILKEIYQHLLKDRMDESELMEKLRELPVVLIDDRYFVRANQTVLSMRQFDQMQPYLNMMPPKFAQYERLFRELGMTIGPSLNQLIYVLNTLHRDNDGRQIDDEKFETACKALRHLFETLLLNGSIDLFSVSHICLPSTDVMLAKSTELIFSDAPALFERAQGREIKFLIDHTACKMDDTEMEKALMKLPEHLRPRRLSELMKEVMHPHSALCAVDGRALEIQKRLKSGIFQQGIIRLINHQLRRKGGQLTDIQIKAITADLDRITVIALKQVTTNLTYKAETVPNSERNEPCFLNKSDLYITQCGSLDYYLLTRLSEIINVLTGGFLGESIIYLISIFTCDVKDISRDMDRLNIRLH